MHSSSEDVCLCPPISELTSCASPSPPKIGPKYYQEIGAEMISNQLIIRLEKDKNKRKKKMKEWDPPCECVEIQRPTSKKGPKIINADYDDRIVFRIHTPPHLIKDEIKTQTIAYKIGACTDKQDQCKAMTIYPQFTFGTQDVYSDHITEDNQDIFLLRVKKKAVDEQDANRNVELEVRTPKPPTPVPSEPEIEEEPVEEEKPKVKKKRKKKKKKK